MKSRVICIIIGSFLAFSTMHSQNEKNFIKVSGTVSDFENNPIKGAVVFIDSVKTETITNKKGRYKIKVPITTKHIGGSTDTYGLLSTSYTGEKTIDFVYRDPKAKTSGDDMKIGVAYKRDKVKSKGSSLKGTNYADFSSVTQLLNARFPFVQTNAAGIKVGKGPNSFNGDQNPLILIDEMRSNVRFFLTLPTIDIAHIKVIRQGSQAAEYGSLGASNGVIIVELRTN